MTDAERNAYPQVAQFIASQAAAGVLVADPTVYPDNTISPSNSALACAISVGAGGPLVFLITYHVERPLVNHRLPGGLTPLLAAASRGRRDIVRQLLRTGANVDATDSRGYGPLHLGVRSVPQLAQQTNADLVPAASGSRVSSSYVRVDVLSVCGMLSDLVAAGASVNAISNKLETPLMLAARTNCVELVRCLLSLGADPSLVDAKGSTAFDYATSPSDPFLSLTSGRSAVYCLPKYLLMVSSYLEFFCLPVIHHQPYKKRKETLTHLLILKSTLRIPQFRWRST